MAIPEAENVPDEVAGEPIVGFLGEVLRAPWTDKIELRRLELGGTYLCYVDVGDGPPVVCIPGWMGTTLNFAPQIESLSRKYRILCFDPIGSGWSDRPSISYSPRENFKFARRFIEKLRVWPATLIGHSLGGTIACALAAENPELVNALCLISPRAPVPNTVPLSQKLFHRLAARFPNGAERIGASVIKVLAFQMMKASMPDLIFEDREKIRSFHREMTRSLGFPRAAARGLVQMNSCSQWSGRLRSIEVPTKIIWGGRDKINPKANIVEIITEIAHATAEIIEGVGHIPMLEAPEFTTQLLDDFLDEVNA